MNKLIVGIVSAIIIGTGSFLLLGNGSSGELTSTNSSSLSTPQPAAPATDKATGSSLTTGSYTLFSEAKFAEAQGTKRVLFFHAPWCGVCKFFEDDLKKNGVPDGVTVLQIDYDSETALKKKYGVQIQATFILLDDNGEATQTWRYALGLTSMADLYEAI